MQRRRDGEYRLREYDPETVHRLAVDRLTTSPGMTADEAQQLGAGILALATEADG
jgi:hypothetical protein